MEAEHQLATIVEEILHEPVKQSTGPDSIASYDDGWGDGASKTPTPNR